MCLPHFEGHWSRKLCLEMFMLHQKSLGVVPEQRKARNQSQRFLISYRFKYAGLTDLQLPEFFKLKPASVQKHGWQRWSEDEWAKLSPQMVSTEKFWKLLPQQSSNSPSQQKNWKNNMMNNPLTRLIFCYVCFIFLPYISPVPISLPNPNSFLLNHLK